MAIRNLILDLGGVIIPLYFDRQAAAFKELGVTHLEEVYAYGKQAQFVDDFEMGRLSAKEFRDELRKRLHISGRVTDAQIDKAWNALFWDLPATRLAYIKELKKQFNKVLLFSNTNKIHHRHFYLLSHEPQSIGSGSAFRGCFTQEYYSFRLGKKKPDPSAFLDILRQEDLLAAETLFVDDSLQNVRGAQKAGLHAIHLNLSRGDDICMLQNFISEVNLKIALEEEKMGSPESEPESELESKPKQGCCAWMSSRIAFFANKQETLPEEYQILPESDQSLSP